MNKEPRFLLDPDSICYGCRYYKHISETEFDEELCKDDMDENGGICDVDLPCYAGSQNDYCIIHIGEFYPYHGYSGTIEYDSEDKIHYGELLDISDFVNYEGETLDELYQSFKNAVDGYIEVLGTI